MKIKSFCCILFNFPNSKNRLKFILTKTSFVSSIKNLNSFTSIKILTYVFLNKNT